MNTNEAQLTIELGRAIWCAGLIVGAVEVRALALQELGELLEPQRMLEELGGFAHLLRCQRVQVDAAARDEKCAEDNSARGGNQAVGRQAQQQALVVGDADGICYASVERGDVAADNLLHGVERIVERVRVGRGAGRDDENLNGYALGAPVENLVLVPLRAGTYISGFAFGVIGGCVGGCVEFVG